MAGIKKISIGELKSIFPRNKITSFEDDFFVAEAVYPEGKMFALEYPCRFDGFIGIFCESGRLLGSIDLKEIDVRRHSFTVSMAGNIIKLSRTENNDPFKLIVIAMSYDCVNRLHIDVKTLFAGGLSPFTHPNIILTKEEILLARRYYSLIRRALASDKKYMAQSVAGLCSSLFYETASVWAKRLPTNKNKDFPNRQRVLFDEFIELATSYHNRERNVSFYANRLCISSKYLARLVKSASGRTASDWIDSFVILEAKNLLKYTDESIKQISTRLNFRNQTIFYKFFKSHTGINPKDFRKSGN